MKLGANSKWLVSTLAIMSVMLVFWGGSQESHAAEDAYEPTVLITGANRGIGLALAKAYAANGWQVIATARKPKKADDLKALAKSNNKVSIEKLDVTNDDHIAALAKKYSGKPVDILINNAGIYGNKDKQTFGQLDYDLFEKIMDVNVAGPLKMAEAFMPHVEASQHKKILTLASGLGSMKIGGRMPSHIFYKMSKSAMNMGMNSLRAAVKKRGVLVALIAPGMVETGLLRASGFPGKGISPEESAKGMIAQIDTLTADMPWTAVNYDGKRIPW